MIVETVWLLFMQYEWPFYTMGRALGVTAVLLALGLTLLKLPPTMVRLYTNLITIFYSVYFLSLLVFFARWATVEEASFLEQIKSLHTVEACIFLGGFAYLVRAKKPFIYGVLEILIAIVGITYATYWQKSDGATKLLTLASGVYLIVRGLDNLISSYQKP